MKNAVNEDGELSEFSDEEESEDEDMGEDEMGLEGELESGNNKEEAEENVSVAASLHGKVCCDLSSFL